jgi:outer membrane protein assembly factor BamB
MMTLTVEPNFTIGGEGRLTLKDIFKAGVTPDRVFTFMGPTCWGIATLERQGQVAPQALRLADARELPVRLQDGGPVVDWSGLVTTAERKGFKPITFTMPEDGYVSLQVLGADGRVVCQLLNGEFRKKGRQEVQWDGLTTLNWRTPGEPVPPGAYTTRAIWHRGIGLRLRGWAANSGKAPWDSDPQSNWGGDHGVPVTCAAAGDKVFLGWSGAEAGKALVACDLAGNVFWKNSRQGMAGAEFTAVDGDLVYAVNWGPEQSNYVYRLNAATGAYAEWPGGTSDLNLTDIFPDARSKPNRVDGLAAGDGKLYLSLLSPRFRREHVRDWRALLKKMRAGEGPAAVVWKQLDDGMRQRTEKWLDGGGSEDEALKAPNYYTPDVRDAVAEALNGLLTAKPLAGGNLAGDAMALANRRAMETAYASEIVKLDTNLVAVVDAKTRKLLHAWPVPQPRQLCAAGAKQVYVVSNGSTVLALDPTSGTTRTVIKGLHNASGVAVDKQNRIYVAVREPENQVKIFTPEGKLLRAIGRPGGRRLLGPWQPDGMAFAQGIAVDAEGKLWVAEADMAPKRISVWDVESGKFVREFFGPSTYGALGGAINPLDPAVMVGQGCEWRLDPQTGRATCLGTITRDGMENSRFGVGANGRLYLAVAGGWAFHSSAIRIFERVADADYKLRATFQYEGKDKAAKTLCWADEDGDGQQQANEATTADGHIRFSGWYMHFTPDMTFYAESRQYKVKGFTACGAPKYDLAHPVPTPGLGLGSADGTCVLSQGAYGESSSWYACFDIASGKKLWTYPDNFVGVHGSHQACPPVVGMIRGSFGPCGTAKLPAPIGNVWVIATNVGEWHILTHDGFYLTRLFQGDPMKIKWPEKAVPGAVMDDTPPGMGGEDFGGSICLARDGKLYVQAGKTGFWNLEVVGLDTVRTLPGSQVSISAVEVKQAEQIRVQLLQAAVGTRKLMIKKRTPGESGNFDQDFAGAEIASYKKQDSAAVRSAAAWDDRNLYLGWEVRDATPWLNAAQVPEQMYTGGDTVDFQLGTDPKADRKRDEAVKGDLRLSIGNFQGKPTAVLYRRVCDVKKPKQFSSGVIKDYRMDFVDVLADAKVKVSVRPNWGYVVEAAVPLSALGLRPADGLALPVDFGVTHGGPDNDRTRLRTYWNNQQTGIVDDVVFELKMEPKNWGEAQFKQ